MLSVLSAFILKLWGWKITGRYPHEVPKLVLAVAPHTSNWDFPVGVLVNSACRIHANYVGKHTLFRWPFGIFFRWLGGIPVDRTRIGSNFVSATVEAFKSQERMHLVIAPEGTRKKVPKLKTGVYQIARQAGVPIALCTFNWPEKEVFFDPKLFYPTDDKEKDMAFIWNYFKDIPGKNPEQGVG
ncbi:MAG: 1-acyl-sn-glycerol-3-phosphate acyltransferase [Saprospirales bacterium]|nr:1-acyl-sn-glycerol-3-phosphate acyltransferase [Saprospirales bacterium]MBK8924101.1 1-acyl-sn-glycerol-3-phosphate acyltransferase [Saprospirales bacterium]